MTGPVDLSKQAIDVGLSTNDLQPSADLLRTFGLAFDHLLKIGGGVHQHRFVCGESIIKLNSHRRTLPTAPSGFVRLRIAAPVDTPTVATSGDGVEIAAIPPGHDDVAGVEITIRTDHPAETGRLIRELGGVPDGDRYRIGESLLAVEHHPNAGEPGTLHAIGFRYITVQVRDVEAAHQYLCSVGFTEGRAPLRLGDTAYISFIRDIGGNWIELSQRASLTGPLPSVREHPNP